MKKKYTVFLLAILRSLVVLTLFGALGFLHATIFPQKSLGLKAIAIVLTPYYLLWFLFMSISVYLNGRPFRILWSGSIRDLRVIAQKNAPYSFAFIICCLIIVVAQSWYAFG